LKNPRETKAKYQQLDKSGLRVFVSIFNSVERLEEAFDRREKEPSEEEVRGLEELCGLS